MTIKQDIQEAMKEHQQEIYKLLLADTELHNNLKEAQEDFRCALTRAIKEIQYLREELLDLERKCEDPNYAFTIDDEADLYFEGCMQTFSDLENAAHIFQDMKANILYEIKYNI